MGALSEPSRICNLSARPDGVRIGIRVALRRIERFRGVSLGLGELGLGGAWVWESLGLGEPGFGGAL